LFFISHIRELFQVHISYKIKRRACVKPTFYEKNCKTLNSRVTGKSLFVADFDLEVIMDSWQSTQETDVRFEPDETSTINVVLFSWNKLVLGASDNCCCFLVCWLAIYFCSVYYDILICYWQWPTSGASCSKNSVFIIFLLC